MYLNFFKRQWCTGEFKCLFNEISTQYSIHALTLQHDKIAHPVFNERFITSIVVTAGNNYMTFPVNGRLTNRDMLSFYSKFNAFATANPTTKNHIPMQVVAIKEMESTLGIDNNVDNDKEHKITFCLNDYTSSEREKIIAFLVNVDGNAPEVYISVDPTSCTHDQIHYLSNLLLCASAIGN